MTLQAIVFMLIVFAIIIGATSYCFWKLLKSDIPLE